jgi:hypothetical protein
MKATGRSLPGDCLFHRNEISRNLFGTLVENKDMIKSLVYLASSGPALIAKIFGEIDLKIFQAENVFAELEIIGNIGGMKKPVLNCT